MKILGKRKKWEKFDNKKKMINMIVGHITEEGKKKKCCIEKERKDNKKNLSATLLKINQQLTQAAQKRS